ncbi:MAG: hypothetical protein LUO93_00725, partial [Methanomicrobiales archaeon]|nr:hypothetical protein [Methanomicrobiales archaeon]
MADGTTYASARCVDDLLRSRALGEEVPDDKVRTFRREEDLIRAAMAYPRAMEDCGVVSTMIAAADYRVAWDAIWRAARVHEGNGPLQPENVLAEMRRHDEKRFSRPFGEKWMALICNEKPLGVAYSLEVIVTEVIARHELNNWDRRAKDLSERIKTADNPRDVYQEWVTEAYRISATSTDGGRLGKDLGAIKDSISGSLQMVRTGIVPFDRATGGGPMTGDMLVIGAGTNTRKSYLAQRMLRNQIQMKRPSLYISTEDPELLLLCRMIADYSGKLDPVAVRDRVLEDASANAGTNIKYAKSAPKEIFDEVEARMRAEQKDLFYSYHCPKWPVSKICALIRRHAHVAGVKSVFLDYLQAVKADEPAKDKNSETSGNVSRLKKCAEENGVVLTLFSQLNRESYKGGEEP